MINLIILGGSGNIGLEILKNIEHNQIFSNIYVFDLNTEPLLPFKNNLKIKIIEKDVVFDNYLQDIIKSKTRDNLKIVNLVAKDYPVTKSGLEDKFKNPFSISTKEYVDSLSITAGSTYNLLKQIIDLKILKVEVVLISSIYEKTLPDPNLYSENGEKKYKPIAYSSGKAAQSPLLKQAAIIFGEAGGRCNCISFGGIKSNQNDVFIENYSKKSPQNKMVPISDAVKMILWLLLESPSSLNGENIMVDGGFTC